MKSSWLITIRRKETKDNMMEMQNGFFTFNTKHPNLKKICRKPNEDIVRMIRIEKPPILMPPIC